MTCVSFPTPLDVIGQKVRVPKVAPLKKRVDADVQAISKLTLSRCDIPPNALRKCCHEAERLLARAISSQNRYVICTFYKKRYSFLLNFQEKSFAILLKKNGPPTLDGVAKKCSVAILIHSLLQNSGAKAPGIEVVARLVNKKGKKIHPEELALEERFGEARSIVKYRGRYDNKVTYLQTYFPYNLLTLARAKASNSNNPYQIVPICHEVGSLLKKMHDQHVVHHDVKFDNVLYKCGESGKDCVRLIDFGRSWEPKNFQVFQWNYATDRFVAVEHIDETKKEFSTDELLMRGKAGDMFALGCLLYQATFLSGIPWGDEMVKFSTRVDLDAGKAAKFKHQQSIEDLQMALKGNLPPAAKILLQILYDLLQADPARRMKIDEFLRDTSLLEKAVQSSSEQIHFRYL